MEYRIRTDLVRAAVVVALGVTASLIVSTAVAARAYRGRGADTSRDKRTLSVKGLARKRLRSDIAVWRIEVKGEGTALAAAYDSLESGLEKVRGFLRENGFPDSEVAVGAIRTETHYRRDEQGNRTREVAAHTLDRMLTVTTKGEVERVAACAGELTRLIREGVRVVSTPPEYYYTRIADLKIELMGLASRDARARAEEIATNAGSRVGAVRSARMGVLQITRPHSTEVSSYGIYDTSTIEKDVRAVVTVTFVVGERTG